MRLTFAAPILAGVLALPAPAALKQGDKAPDFTAQAAQGGKEFTFHLKDALKKGPVVVYFYPAAFTGGCNAEAHAFSENSDKFAAAGASIIGVSLDNMGTLKPFSADPQFCAGKIPVAADPQAKVAQSYDLKIMPEKAGAKDTRGEEIGHRFAERTTFIVKRDGTIAAAIGGVSPTDNVSKSLEAVQQLKGSAGGSH